MRMTCPCSLSTRGPYSASGSQMIISSSVTRNTLGVKKLPTVKSLQIEFAEQLSAKKEAYAELKKVRDELRDVAVHTANYEELRDLAKRDPRKEKEHGRE